MKRGERYGRGRKREDGIGNSWYIWGGVNRRSKVKWEKWVKGTYEGR